VIFNDCAHLLPIVRAEEFLRNPRFEPVSGLQKSDCGNKESAIEEQEKSAELHVAHQPRIVVDGSAGVTPVENLNEATVARAFRVFGHALNDAMMRNSAQGENAYWPGPGPTQSPCPTLTNYHIYHNFC
jgi:hypothetical protein